MPSPRSASKGARGTSANANTRSSTDPAANPTAGWEVRESGLTRWTRRAATIPGVSLAALLLWVTAPLLLLLSLALDAVRPRRGAVTRLLLFGLVYLAAEVAGLVVAGLVWVGCPPLLGASRERFERWNFRLQVAWAGVLFRTARVLFGLRVRCEGDEQMGHDSALVLIRHVSIVDTLLPAVFLSARHGWRLRYVLKRELLWDPCLDVVGQRLPNVFVLRGAGEGELEIRAIRALAAGLGPREGVLIYPEGTRASPARRERALARIEAAGDAERLERARALQHLLPPRHGGTLALLDAAGAADVLFFAHAGLEGLRNVGDVLSGALVGRRLSVSLRRVAREEIPPTAAGRGKWLDAEWARMDDWVAARAA